MLARVLADITARRAGNNIGATRVQLSCGFLKRTTIPTVSRDQSDDAKPVADQAASDTTRGLMQDRGWYRERSHVAPLLLGVPNANRGRQHGIESISHHLSHEVRQQRVAAERKMATLVLNRAERDDDRP